MSVNEWVDKTTTVWEKKQVKDEIYEDRIRYKNVNKCLINYDIYEKNMVPLDKMNSIDPETKIISSNLYIQNKKFAMDSKYMPEYVETKYTFHNINDPTNNIQGYAYKGEMSGPMHIGRHTLFPVRQTTKSSRNEVDELTNNVNGFTTLEGYNNDYDGIVATTNSVVSKLSTMDELNQNIKSNKTTINSLYTTLSGNCSGTDLQKQDCIKYKFSSDSDITKKIVDKNDAYADDLAEVQLQQNNIYVLGAITTASLLIFAIMLGRE